MAVSTELPEHSSFRIWEVLDGVGVDGVGGNFPFSFFSVFFAFLLFSPHCPRFPRTRASNCNFIHSDKSDPVCTDPVRDFLAYFQKTFRYLWRFYSLLFRGFFVALFCLEKQCSGLFRYFFVVLRGFFVAPVLGKFYAYSPWNSLLIFYFAHVMTREIKLVPSRRGIALQGELVWQQYCLQCLVWLVSPFMTKAQWLAKKCTWASLWCLPSWTEGPRSCSGLWCTTTTMQWEQPHGG